MRQSLLRLLQEQSVQIQQQGAASESPTL
jgi:hypothetical protein